MGIWRGLTHNRAFTDDESPDPRLRPRTYAIPFVIVWEAALAIARGTRGWTVTASDPLAGEIVAEATTRAWKFVDDVWIRISLDEDGQTHVEMTSASRVGRADLGTNARRIARFLHALDAQVLGDKRANR
ncbi:DUF1499 domain-containing protein [Longimicrobium sp.]|uniref:DUF1499 domain-containing protein n=1 Tax=Longimicrobium sp. TaxID=2029185 RepID=UPI002E2EF884|nr:DUF1499 domain-containing protein [Longimicrobium sp.]HEX6039554.1 DUF1499 domain-containing protein [Longimicrobium sp.]